MVELNKIMHKNCLVLYREVNYNAGFCFKPPTNLNIP